MIPEREEVKASSLLLYRRTRDAPRLVRTASRETARVMSRAMRSPHPLPPPPERLRMAKKKEEKKQAPEKAPLVTLYDKDGTKIGDDGYPMTPVRSKMHTLFNAYFIWMLVMIVICIACIICSYLQGQEITSWELIYSGGNHYNGYSVATILRIEALLCLITAFLGLLINLFGFGWLYDKRSPRLAQVSLAVIGVASLACEIAALATIHLPEVVSIVNLVLIVLTFTTMRAVDEERPTLKKAKVARKVIKTKKGTEEVEV